MSQQLQVLIAEIDACSEHAKRLLEKPNQSQLTQRPQNGGWSAVECVKHLTLTTDLYLNHLPPLIKQAREERKVGEGPFKMDWKGRLLKRILEPPYRARAKTLTSLEVVTNESPGHVLGEFLASQAKLKALYASADGIALDRVMMRSPFNQRVRYNLYSCLCVITTHQRRHLWQAEQALMQLR